VQRHDAPHVRTELRKAQFAVDKDKESVGIVRKVVYANTYDT
jgi:hypothetical protein